MIGGVAVSRTRHGLRCRPRVTVSAQAKRPDVPTLGEGHNTPPGLRPAAASRDTSLRGRSPMHYLTCRPAPTPRGASSVGRPKADTAKK